MLELGTFTIDGTPPVGCGVDFGLTGRTTGVRDPLRLRGFALRHGSESCLLVSADWCGLMGSAFRDLREALAAGAGISSERVVVHCTHQHDAPLLDFEIEALVGQTTFPRSWWDGLLAAGRAAANAAVHGMMRVQQVGRAETRLHGYASNRRILGPDGRVRGMRFSRCADAALVAEPVGTIDPMLRTLAFRDDRGRLAATLSFYATHPQVSNGRALYSADAPGEATRLVFERVGGGTHALLTGAGGNVTAGKHSSPTDLEGNLKRFGRILADGITRNLAAMEWESPGSFAWKARSFPFPADAAKGEAMRALLADPARPAGPKSVGAAVLGAMDDPANSSYALSALSLGSATLLFLPGEPFVEYQLYAQSLRPDGFLAMAANCGDDFLYLPTAASFPQGGYEVESFRWCTPEIEELLQGALRSILA